MELSLIKSLMDKDFYECHKGIRCPDKLFTKEVQKIKQAVDYAMEEYGNSLSVSDLKGSFLSNNISMTTANKEVYDQLFRMLDKEQPMAKPIADKVLSRLFQSAVGTEIANLGFDYVNGKQTSLEPLRNILSTYQEDFIPEINMAWEDTDIDYILDKASEQSQWKFNIPELRHKVEGISAGHLVIVGARPNTGKTSFHASVIVGEGGFASQGAKCIVLCNEEAPSRVTARYLSAASNMSLKEIRTNKQLANERWLKVKNKVKFVGAIREDFSYVETVIKYEKPDIVVLDMGDKFASKRAGDMSPHEYLKEAAILARVLAIEYKCAIIWMSQLSADAEGVEKPDQSMLEGSKTGKAAEADLMLLIARKVKVESGKEYDTMARNIHVAKNKLNGGYHGICWVLLDGDRSVYS